jgi:hypothetical protein
MNCLAARWNSILGIVALITGFSGAALAQDGGIPTRFGTLTIGNGYIVLFNGRPVRPTLQGNTALSFERRFKFAAADVVLFEDIGGTACPELWAFVTVSSSGARATPEFGSCGELLGVKQEAETIVLRTRGFQGEFEPRAAQERAAQEAHVFVFKGGVVTEGKVVPMPPP